MAWINPKPMALFLAEQWSDRSLSVVSSILKGEELCKVENREWAIASDLEGLNPNQYRDVLFSSQYDVVVAFGKGPEQVVNDYWGERPTILLPSISKVKTDVDLKTTVYLRLCAKNDSIPTWRGRVRIFRCPIANEIVVENLKNRLDAC